MWRIDNPVSAFNGRNFPSVLLRLCQTREGLGLNSSRFPLRRRVSLDLSYKSAVACHRYTFWVHFEICLQGRFCCSHTCVKSQSILLGSRPAVSFTFSLPVMWFGAPRPPCSVLQPHACGVSPHQAEDEVSTLAGGGGDLPVCPRA